MPDPTDRPLIMLSGEWVALGPMDRTLFPLLHRWHTDLPALLALGLPPIPRTLEQLTAQQDAFLAAPDEVRFLIYEQTTGRPIGLTCLAAIDARHGTARFVLFIGEADCRGKGFGTEATRLMLAYAFATLGLHTVMLTVYAFNHAGLRAYAKAGFREFGRRRQAYRTGDRRWDVIYMECLASEFVGTSSRTAPSP